jgi:hypothetical protein
VPLFAVVCGRENRVMTLVDLMVTGGDGPVRRR